MKQKLFLALIAGAFLLVMTRAVEAGGKCETTDECEFLYQCTEDVCEHKSLFPITAAEVLGTILVCLLNSVATGGGVGAGAVFVPWIQLIMNQPLSTSIDLAYTVVFGGGLGNFLNIVFLRNKKKNRPYINYNLNLIIIPALMIGVMVGVLFKKVNAPYISSALLVGILSYSATKYFKKYRSTKKKELILFQKLKEKEEKKKKKAEQKKLEEESKKAQDEIEKNMKQNGEKAPENGEETKKDSERQELAANGEVAQKKKKKKRTGKKTQKQKISVKDLVPEDDDSLARDEQAHNEDQNINEQKPRINIYDYEKKMDQIARENENIQKLHAVKEHEDDSFGREEREGAEDHEENSKANIVYEAPSKSELSVVLDDVSVDGSKRPHKTDSFFAVPVKKQQGQNVAPQNVNINININQNDVESDSDDSVSVIGSSSTMPGRMLSDSRILGIFLEDSMEVQPSKKEKKKKDEEIKNKEKMLPSASQLNLKPDEQLVANTEEESEKKGAITYRPGMAKKREQILKSEQQQIPWKKMLLCIWILVIIVVLGLIRGGKKVESIVGIEYCGDMDFGMLGIIIAAFAISLLVNLFLIRKWQDEKKEYEIEFTPEDPEITKRHMIKLSILGILAGAMGASVAISGSFIMTPALFDMGVPPATVACTAGMFMIFTMFNSIFQVYVSGGVTEIQILWFACIAFVFSFISSKLVNWYAKKTGKQAFIPLMILLLSASGLVVVIALFIYQSVDDWSEVSEWKELCPSK